MSREELIQRIAREAKLSKAQANRTLKALISGVTENLKKGKRVSLVGFGTFTVANRKARTGRNPQTGAPIKISAARVARFRPGKQLKDAVRKGSR
jgi:DNA-binding protein HU-beta